jgi:hypothetical protein
MAENFPGFCVSFSLSALNDRLTGLSDKCSAPSELSNLRIAEKKKMLLQEQRRKEREEKKRNKDLKKKNI